MEGLQYMAKKVIVITGPTGVGKTTVAKYLEQQWHMARVITHTTRTPRAHETDGRDYYFETSTSFNRNHYLESVVYAGAQYGSSLEGLDCAWQKSEVVTIVLDTAGAITYAQELADKVIILYISVSDSNVLRQRLAKRGDHPEQQQHRLQSAEYLRDLALPPELVGRATLINNDNWHTTKKILQEFLILCGIMDLN
ncbi:guanylate kinase [Convivina praedatoris]|uniref:Guanylate kinase n=1 Tax=Convivina praedatoris TaxID=2880963 RepID=A0ABN8HB27_9LACO|nr:AAA family ATPase [Convivina sp. LMG 32447]CAH1856609.1 Guanylate kinase [Convivina sp. LMG 32447]CAH1856997.1 Guanylate kinase [Convivina sp. LMG 32447]CAH1857253.1 Guanylate kinase [Convivina sp. LMG 32447]